MAERASSCFRAVNSWISSTATSQLPAVIPHIVLSIVECGSFLCSPDNGTKKDKSDAIVRHQFKTRITSLANHKTVQGRWAGIVLIKTAIDTGGSDVLENSGHWVQSLLSILKKPDPPVMKKLCMICLTRIFMIRHPHVNSVTSSALPAFITTCLNLVSAKTLSSKTQQLTVTTSVLPTVLECFQNLLPDHANIFRSFLSQLQTILLPLLAPTPSSTKGVESVNSLFPPSALVQAARRLFSLLHLCAPKSSSTEEWEKTFTTVLSDAHVTANQVFRAVIEDWTSIAGVPSQTMGPAAYDDEVHQDGPTLIGLPGWYGIHAGCERICGFLELLRQFLLSKTAGPVALPAGNLVDFLTRVTSLTTSVTNNDGTVVEGPLLNNQVTKDEREALWLELPNIHVAATNLIQAYCQRFGMANPSLNQLFIDQIEWVFRREKHNTAVRELAYSTISQLLQISGPTKSKAQIRSIILLIETCCEDIIPRPEALRSQAMSNINLSANGHVPNGGLLHVDSSHHYMSSMFDGESSLRAAALTLLTTFLSKVSSERAPRYLRASADRTAVLSGELQLMLASVQNPLRSSNPQMPQSSILPFMARAHPSSAETESLIRPRMPLIPPLPIDADDRIDDDDEGDPAMAAADEYSQSSGMPLSLSDQGQALSEVSIIDAETERNQLQHESVEAVDERSLINTLESKDMIAMVSSGRKRTSDQTDSEEPETKRKRSCSVDLGKLAASDIMPGQEPSLVPVTVIVQEPGLGSQDPLVASMPADEIVRTEVNPYKDNANSDGDDDFVIPELNLEPDTDDEEEAEDIDEEDGDR